MKLLFDQYLSFKLVRLLADDFPDSTHVRNLDLLEADDEIIWRHATGHRFVIVSKDSDFHQMSLLYGHPPKIVWLRVGNAPTSTVAELLRRHLATMRRFHEDPHSSRFRKDRPKPHLEHLFESPRRRPRPCHRPRPRGRAGARKFVVRRGGRGPARFRITDSRHA